MIPNRAPNPPPPGWTRAGALGLCATHYNLQRRRRAIASDGRYRPGPRGRDVDTIAVERAVNGDRTIILNAGERAAAVDELRRRGLSVEAIAERLGLSQRSVTRIRARLRAAAA